MNLKAIFLSAIIGGLILTTIGVLILIADNGFTFFTNSLYNDQEIYFFSLIYFLHGAIGGIIIKNFKNASPKLKGGFIAVLIVFSLHILISLVLSFIYKSSFLETYFGLYAVGFPILIGGYIFSFLVGLFIGKRYEN